MHNATSCVNVRLLTADSAQCFVLVRAVGAVFIPVTQPFPADTLPATTVKLLTGAGQWPVVRGIARLWQQHQAYLIDQHSALLAHYTPTGNFLPAAPRQNILFHLKIPHCRGWKGPILPILSL